MTVGLFSSFTSIELTASLHNNNQIGRCILFWSNPNWRPAVQCAFEVTAEPVRLLKSNVSWFCQSSSKTDCNNPI